MNRPFDGARSDSASLNNFGAPENQPSRAPSSATINLERDWQDSPRPERKFFDGFKVPEPPSAPKPQGN
jgi:hypothetical protein